LAYLLLVAKPGIVEHYSLVFNLLLVLLGPFSILLACLAIFSKSKLGYALATITVFSAWAFLACVAIMPARFLDVQSPRVPGPPPPPLRTLLGLQSYGPFQLPVVPHPLPPPSSNVKRIRLGPKVKAAKLVFQPQPVYPALAKMARIQGTVRLDAVINRDGTVGYLRVISGHPLLVRAALVAVQRWRYQPTLLNGAQVEVATEIGVDFTLPQ
jgi:TonB family protein